MIKEKTFQIERPWGNFRQFTKNELSTVKIITVKPNEILSLQTHNKRSEFWHIIKGEGTVEIGEEKKETKAGDEHEIKIEEKHRMSAGPDELRRLLSLSRKRALGARPLSGCSWSLVAAVSCIAARCACQARTPFRMILTAARGFFKPSRTSRSGSFRLSSSSQRQSGGVCWPAPPSQSAPASSPKARRQSRARRNCDCPRPCGANLPLDRVPGRRNKEGDSQTARIIIHHSGWKGGQHEWQSPIRGIYGNAWCGLSFPGSPGARRHVCSMSARAVGSS